MSEQDAIGQRASTNPVRSSSNRLKLGVFAVNVSGGASMTDMPNTIKVEWDESVAIARAAEQAGIEAIIPVARWKGMGGSTNFNHRNFETLTWAAGLAAATERIGVFATVHLPTIHPVRAAKEVATIDHISGGRFSLNMVAGGTGTRSRCSASSSGRTTIATRWPMTGSRCARPCGATTSPSTGMARSSPARAPTRRPSRSSVRRRC